jgi:hypothetical protein
MPRNDRLGVDARVKPGHDEQLLLSAVPTLLDFHMRLPCHKRGEVNGRAGKPIPANFIML